MHVILETDRLILRHFTPDDLDDLSALNADPAVMLYINGGQPIARAEIEQDHLPRYLGYHARPEGYGFFVAEEKASGGFLGWFHLRPARDAPPDELELGYRLQKSAWNKGFATEGSRALIRHAFEELGARCIVATTMVVNQGSRRVMEKAGLRFVRTFFLEWPDKIPGDELGDVEYALTRAEWEARQAPSVT